MSKYISFSLYVTRYYYNLGQIEKISHISLTSIPSGRYTCHMTTQTTKHHILDAANKIIQREGVAHLTIEAVAKEAGMSKGGVLYHFPSKDVLIEEMIAFYIEGFNTNLNKELARETAEPGRWSRANIRASSSSTVEEPPEEVAAVTGLIAAIATNPQLLDPLRKQYDEWQKQAESDNIAPTLATILRLAVDGLWLADMLGFASPKGKFREEVINAMLTMTRTAQD